jgi:uncharacterized protein (DUF58 family)
VRRRIDGELWGALVGVAVAGVGWGFHSTLLALMGTLVALAALLLWVWQRQCLTGVSYSRTLRQRRATFGEDVGLDVELVNDKLLPLTWLHVEDEVPLELTIRGATLTDGNLRAEMHHLLPLLPFQRVRRRLTVVCDRRGEHEFGPVRISSGDPIGLRQRHLRVPDRAQLLVYPKLFRLVSFPVASRVPLGDVRARVSVIDDPSRVAGVREYQQGDPLRHIDWRATARGGTLLVREFEPSSTVRVAVFLDMRALSFGPLGANDDVIEFTIALGASVVAELVGRGIGTGLYASGTVDGRAIVREPASSPAALPAMLEQLARASPYASASIAQMLLAEGSRLLRGTSIVVVAPDFNEPTLVALSELRRRTPITALWVANEHGQPPPAELVDITREVAYDDGWKQREVVELHR